MTAAQAIAAFDNEYENDIPQSVKLSWLWQLDGIIYNDLIITHEDAPERQTDEQDGSRELLVPSPYDEIYFWYLRSRAHMQIGEIELYNNALALYSAGYEQYARFYNRTHMPKSESINNYTGW